MSSLQVCNGEKNQRDLLPLENQRLATKGLASRNGLLGCQIYRQNLRISLEGSYMYSICDNIQSFRVKTFRVSSLKTNFF